MPIVRVPVTLTSTIAGGPFMNVLHFNASGPQGTETEMGEALTALHAFYNGLVNVFPPGLSIRFGEGMVQDPLGNPQFLPDDPHSITVGAASLNVPATFAAIVVGWRTASATRRGRGRTFIGPLRQNAWEGEGTPTAQALAYVRTAATTLVEDSRSANGWALGVLSTVDGQFREVTGNTVHDRFGVLRSRRA